MGNGTDGGIMFQHAKHWFIAAAGALCAVTASAGTMQVSFLESSISASISPSPSPSPRDAQLVDEAVHAWAQSWDRGDVSEYLAHYADDFVPSSGLTHRQWEQQRRERLKATAIRYVMLRDVQVAVADSGTASASFTQHYLDMGLMSTARKRLTLVKQAGEWKIREEQIEAERMVRR